MLKLLAANIMYGARAYPVEQSEHAPIPDMDFDKVDEVIEKTMAVMSNQSGGHEFNEARFHFAKDKTFAKLNGNGFVITWGTQPGKFPAGLPTDELIKLIEERSNSIVRNDVRFGIRADQYGEGWKRAVKTPWKPFPHNFDNM